MLANRKKLILPLEKYLKYLNGMIIGTKSFTIFEIGPNNGVEIWTFGVTQGRFQIKLPLILILQMKKFSVMFRF